MIRAEPKEFELGGTTPIWVRPGEDITMFFRSDESMIENTDFELTLSEYRWPYMPKSHDLLDDIVISEGFSEVEERGRYRIYINLDKDFAGGINNRRFDLKLIGKKDGTSWVICNSTLTISKGD